MYNNECLHSALQYFTPLVFLLKYGKIKIQNVEDFPTFQQSFNNDNKNYLPKTLLLNVSRKGEITLP